MKTLEEKAWDYIEDIDLPFEVDKDPIEKAFIAGYTTRDGESNEVIGALQDLMVMFELIREHCNTSLGDIAYKKAAKAIENYLPTI